MFRASIAQLLNRPMDRKTFLKTVALGVALVGGAGGIISLLNSRKTEKTALGYGSSVYGGGTSTK